MSTAKRGFHLEVPRIASVVFGSQARCSGGIASVLPIGFCCGAESTAQKLLYIWIQHAMNMGKLLYLLAGQQNGTTGEFENHSTQRGLRMGLCRTRRCTMTARVLQAF